MQERMDQKRIHFGNGRLPACLKPHFVPARAHMSWVEKMEALLDLLERVGRRMLEDNDLYPRACLPPQARDLMLIDPGYERMAVVCRPDLAWRDDEIFIYGSTRIARR